MAERIKPNVYISVDVEADGPIPGPYSMLSFGAAVAGRHDASGFTPAAPDAHTFYRELRPISDTYDAEAVAVSGLDRERLLAEGADPAAAMAAFVVWVEEARGGAKPIVVGYPACYDWMFLYWYLMRFAGRSPFGHSGCLDMKTLYAVKAGLPLGGVAKRTMPRHLLPDRPHTHHALDDAMEQAELFANLMPWSGPANAAIS
jgi:hypothetical protein